MENSSCMLYFSGSFLLSRAFICASKVLSGLKVSCEVDIINKTYAQMLLCPGEHRLNLMTR